VHDGSSFERCHVTARTASPNPHVSCVILNCCRPTSISSSEHKPLPQLLTIPELERLGQEQLRKQEAKAAAAIKEKDWVDQLVDQQWLQLFLNWIQDLNNVGPMQQQQTSSQQHSRQGLPSGDQSDLSVIDNFMANIKAGTLVDTGSTQAASHASQNAPSSQRSSSSTATRGTSRNFSAVVCNLSPKNSTASGSAGASPAGSLSDYAETAPPPGSSFINYGSTSRSVHNQRPPLQVSAAGNNTVPVPTAAAAPAGTVVFVKAASPGNNSGVSGATSNVSVLKDVTSSSRPNSIAPAESATIRDSEEVPGLVVPGDDLSVQSNLDRVEFTSFLSSDDEEAQIQTQRRAALPWLTSFNAESWDSDPRSIGASWMADEELGSYDGQGPPDLSAGGGGRVYGVAGWSMLKDDTLDSLDSLPEGLLEGSSTDLDGQHALAQGAAATADGAAVDAGLSLGTAGAAGVGVKGQVQASSSAAATVQPSGTERSSSPATASIGLGVEHVSHPHHHVMDAFADSSSLEYVPRVRDASCQQHSSTHWQQQAGSLDTMISRAELASI
jgi:hypothetical protein